VYYEVCEEIGEAVKREKQLKKYLRFHKIKLIEKMNPAWQDLTETIIA